MVKLDDRKPQPVTEMILVQTWFEELKRLCPTGKCASLLRPPLASLLSVLSPRLFLTDCPRNSRSTPSGTFLSAHTMF